MAGRGVGEVGEVRPLPSKAESGFQGIPGPGGPGVETLIADGLRVGHGAAAKTVILSLSGRRAVFGDGANLLFINGENLMPSFLAEQGKTEPWGYLANFVTALPHSYPQFWGKFPTEHCGTAGGPKIKALQNSGRG